MRKTLATFFLVAGILSAGWTYNVFTGQFDAINLTSSSFTICSSGCSITPVTCTVNVRCTITHSLNTTTPIVSLQDSTSKQHVDIDWSATTNGTTSSANVISFIPGSTETFIGNITTGGIGPAGAAGATGATGQAGANGAMPDPGSNGIMVRTALNTTAARTIVSSNGNCVITNGDGVAGNPSFNCSGGGGSVGPAVEVYSSGNYTINGVTAFSPDTINWDTSSGTLWSVGTPTHFVATSAGRWTLKCRHYESAATSSAAFPFMVNNVNQHVAIGGTNNVFLVPGTWIRANNSDQNISLILNFTVNMAINDYLIENLFTNSVAQTFDGGILSNSCIFYKEAY